MSMLGQIPMEKLIPFLSLLDTFREQEGDKIKSLGESVNYGNGEWGLLTPPPGAVDSSDLELGFGLSPVFIKNKNTGEICFGLSIGLGYEIKFLVCKKGEEPPPEPEPPMPPPGGRPPKPMPLPPTEPPKTEEITHSCDTMGVYLDDPIDKWILFEYQVLGTASSIELYTITDTVRQMGYVEQRYYEYSWDKIYNYNTVLTSTTTSASNQRSTNIKENEKIWIKAPRTHIKKEQRTVKKPNGDVDVFETFVMCVNGYARWHESSPNSPRLNDNDMVNDIVFEMGLGEMRKISLYSHLASSYGSAAGGPDIPTFNAINAVNWSSFWAFIAAGIFKEERYDDPEINKVLEGFYLPQRNITTASLDVKTVRSQSFVSVIAEPIPPFVPSPPENPSPPSPECNDMNNGCCEEQLRLTRAIYNKLGIVPGETFLEVPETLIIGNSSLFGKLGETKPRKIKSQAEFNVYLLERILELTGSWQMEIDVPLALQKASKSEANALPPKIVCPDIRSALEVLIRLSLNVQDDEDTLRSFLTRILLETHLGRLAAYDAAAVGRVVVDWTQAETKEEIVQMPVTFTPPDVGKKNLDNIDRDEEIKAFLKESKQPVKTIKYADKFGGFKQFKALMLDVRAIVRSAFGKPMDTTGGINGLKEQVKKEIRGVDETASGRRAEKTKNNNLVPEDSFKAFTKELEKQYGVEIQIINDSKKP